MADRGVEGEEGFVAGGYPAGVDDDLMLDINEEDLIFSEDTFLSLPDFPCLSSPSATSSLSSACTFQAKSTVLSSCSSTSSSSSSSSWSFLQVPDGGGVIADMQQQQCQHQQAEVPSVIDEITMLAPPSLFNHHHPVGGLDILGDISLFDTSVDPWDPSTLFHADEASTAAGGAAVASHEMQPCQLAEEGHWHGHGEGGAPSQQQQQQEEDNSSEELARIFLEWLRSNKDSISPEDLRSIKLKRATIESAARRLGQTKQGRMQLLKLILAWVQNNHLQRKRLQPPFSYDHQPRPFPITSNPNQLDYGYSSVDSNLTPRCNSWMPYSMDPSLTAYGSGEMMYPGATAHPYPYHHSYGTSSVVVNSQPFSPTPDFVDPTAGPWPAQLAIAMPQFAPFPGTSGPYPLSMVPPQYPGGFANQFPGHPMYHQGQPLAGTALTTKEARRKRMARQRRFSSLHHHRNHNQQHSHRPVGPTEGAIGSSHSNASNWPFWTSLSPSSLQMNHTAETQNSSNMLLTPTLAAQPQKKSQHSAVSSSWKRQVFP